MKPSNFDSIILNDMATRTIVMPNLHDEENMNVDFRKFKTNKAKSSSDAINLVLTRYDFTNTKLGILSC
jgi:hypothetical protein